MTPSFTPSSYCRRGLLGGIVALIWFASFFQGAHDLWAACIIFAGLTSITIIFTLIPTANSVRIPLLMPFGGLLLAGTFSLHHSYDLAGTRFELWGVGFSVLLFLLSFNLIHDEADAQWLYHVTGFVLIPLAIIALYQQCSPSPGLRPDPQGRWEIPATLVSSNVLAGFSLNWTIFYLASYRRSRINQACAAASILLLLLARSTGAWIALAVGLLYFFRVEVLKWRERHSRTSGLVAGVIVLCLGLLLYWKLNDHVGTYSGTGRLQYWFTAVRMGMSHPFTGIGLGAYGAAYPFFKFHGPAQGTLFAHSSLLSVWAECGVSGVLAFVFFCISFMSLLRTTRPAQTNHRLSDALSATLIASLVFSLTSIHLHYLVNHMMLLVLLACRLSPVSAPSLTWSPLRKWGTVSVLVLIIPLWLSPLIASRWLVDGLMAEKDKDLRRAMSFYINAHDLDPWNAEASLGLARLSYLEYLATRDKDLEGQAKSWLEEAQRRKPLVVRPTPFKAQPAK